MLELTVELDILKKLEVKRLTATNENAMRFEPETSVLFDEVTSKVPESEPSGAETEELAVVFEILAASEERKYNALPTPVWVNVLLAIAVLLLYST